MNASHANTPSAQMVKLLGALSLACGLLIVAVQQGTLHPIRENQDIILRETVSELLPGIKKQIIYNVTASGELAIVEGEEGTGSKLIAGYDNSGSLLGIVIEGGERGYADVIRALYVFSPAKMAITSFKVIELKETPGLGDRITSDVEFLANFRDLDATHPIATVRHGTKKNKWEVDAISGATISSRAVGRLLAKSTTQMIPVIKQNLNRIERGQ